MKFIILGDGLLGTELHKQTGWEYFSRKKDKFDITNKNFIEVPKFGVNVTLINCIAHTDTYSSDRDKHWDVNVVGVKNLLEYCKKWGCKLVHISTDYIYTNSSPKASEEDVPVHCNNWYGYTKLVGDALVQLDSDKHLIIRETHKPIPFPYKEAWVDQIGNFDYVNKITSLIIKLIKQNCKGIYNVGTEVKSIYDMALQTKKVTPVTKPSNVPSNTTMNLNKLQNVIKEIN